MGYLRTMGAGLAGSTTKLYGNANVNQIQYGDKLQGLPPVTGVRRPYKIYRSKAGGNAPGRFRVFCVNQLGGVGNVKNSQFAPNADGVGWCPNPMNRARGAYGIHSVDRADASHRHVSRGTVKKGFAECTDESSFGQGVSCCHGRADCKDVPPSSTCGGGFTQSGGASKQCACYYGRDADPDIPGPHWKTSCASGAEACDMVELTANGGPTACPTGWVREP